MHKMKQLKLPFKDVVLKETIKRYNDFIRELYYDGVSLDDIPNSVYDQFSWEEAYSLRETCNVSHLGSFFIERENGKWVETCKYPEEI